MREILERVLNALNSKREKHVVTDAHGRDRQIVVDIDNDGEFISLDLSDFEDLSDPYISTTLDFYDIESFVDYAQVFKSSSSRGGIAINTARNSGDLATCWIDFDSHTPDKPGRKAHKAKLKMEVSEELRTLMQATSMRQEQFCDLIEDNIHLFSTPDGAQLMETVQKFRATMSSRFQRVINRENGDIDLVYATETETPAELHVPKDLTLLAPLVQNGPHIEIPGRFQYNVREGVVTFGLRLPGISTIITETVNNLKSQLAEATDVPFHLMRP